MANRSARDGHAHGDKRLPSKAGGSVGSLLLRLGAYGGSGDRFVHVPGLAAGAPSAMDPYCDRYDYPDCPDTADRERSKPTAIVTGPQRDDPTYG
jgi:hypothetical protein